MNPKMTIRSKTTLLENSTFMLGTNVILFASIYVIVLAELPIELRLLAVPAEGLGGVGGFCLKKTATRNATTVPNTA